MEKQILFVFPEAPPIFCDEVTKLVQCEWKSKFLGQAECDDGVGVIS